MEGKLLRWEFNFNTFENGEQIQMITGNDAGVYFKNLSNLLLNYQIIKPKIVLETIL